MFYAMLQGRMPFSLFNALTQNDMKMARLVGYLGALR